MHNELEPVARSLEVPVTADSIESPIVTYGDGPASINFLVDDGRWGRVTFEKLDSIRISRGEYEPYESSGPRSWVATVSNSPWLRERYEYEKRHYGNAYEFGGDVGEMLRDFSHYIFRFHDQFVEALSPGIWFETAGEYLGSRPIEPPHPLADLPESSISQRLEAYGIPYQVRQNPAPLNELVKSAAFCSQSLFEFAAELDGDASVSWTVSLRTREGRTRAYLQSYFGNVEAEYDAIPSLADVQPRIEEWLREVHERRTQMGKR